MTESFQGFSEGFKTAAEREWEIAHLAWAEFHDRPANHIDPPTPPERRSPMSGRRIRSFKDSLDQLDSDMLEGEDAGNGQVFGKWGIKKDRLDVAESKALLDKLLASGELKRSR